MAEESVLWHQSGVAPDGTPFVQLIRNTEIIAQMSIEQARDHSRAVLEACEAAEQDAFIMDFARDIIGMPWQDAGKILLALRNYRAKRTGKSQGPTSARDWVMPPPDKIPKYPDDPGDFTKKEPRK